MRRWTIPAVLVACAIGAPSVSAQASRFRYRPDIVPVGTVYHYTKSNLDGSNPWRLSAYVASRTRLDVLKWAGGPGELVNVVADFNPAQATVDHIEQWNPRGGEMTLTMAGELSLDGKTLTMSLPGGQRLAMAAGVQPCHVFGFDLQSLGFAFRHLDDATRSFEVGLVGMNRHPSAERPEPVVYLGRARFEYAGDEQVRGAACRKFRIAGEAMEGKEGAVWFDRIAGHIVRIESPWPISSDWTSYRLELDSVEQMTPFAWQEFRSGVLSKFTRGATPFRRDMEKAYQAGGLDAAMTAYAELKRVHARAPEGELNAFAYGLLDRGRAKDAAAVLEFAIVEFPDSANLHDSLGEVYGKLGDRELAIRHYTRSLELDPANDNAREMLRKLATAP